VSSDPRPASWAWTLQCAREYLDSGEDGWLAAFAGAIWRCRGPLRAHDLSARLARARLIRRLRRLFHPTKE
jgi:hypothetical protein